ncbi:MAG: tetratricopeptide repeat protein [Gammaproteobacteria bacterium]|nr:MAG: tetratricopeptide repeat protein [Gammaproteobacteria bacterium]
MRGILPRGNAELVQSLRRAVFALPIVALAACATAPVPHSARNAAPAPLARIQVTPDSAERDLMTQIIAGEFALTDANAEAAARLYADAAQRSDDPSIAEQATRVAIAGHQWQVAHATLARWQALVGESAAFRQARARIALHDNYADVAYADLDALLKQPDDKGWGAVAQTLLSAEDKQAAGAMLERLLGGGGATKAAPARLAEAKPEIWIVVGQLAQRLERKQLAASLAEQALLRFHTPDAYIWAAQLHLIANDKAGARKLFADALRASDKPASKASKRLASADEGKARLRMAYAKLLADAGENIEAAQVLAQGTQNDYTYAARAAYLARASEKTAKLQIDDLYQQVQALPPPRAPARVMLLGQLAELGERRAEALAWYGQISSDDERWFNAQLRTAVVLNDSGKSADAFNLLHGLQARSADDAKEVGETFLLEAELLNKQKRGEEAIAVYDRGLAVLPDDTRLIYARALLNDDLDHVDAAVHDLRRVLELKPDDADAMNALGYTLADRTDSKTEALALIERALVLKPGEPAIIDSLGWVQYRLGNLEAALVQLRMAFQKQPDAEIAAHLGEVLWVSGKRDEARQVWEQGRKKDGANKVLNETIKRLAS